MTAFVEYLLEAMPYVVVDKPGLVARIYFVAGDPVAIMHRASPFCPATQGIYVGVAWNEAIQAYVNYVAVPGPSPTLATTSSSTTKSRG